jgi:hypothetical protein
MAEERRTNDGDPGDTESKALLYRVPNLSFCPLKEAVIVLDPNQGLYFRMTLELASILQSLPEVENDGNRFNGSCLETLTVDARSKLASLIQYGLIEKKEEQGYQLQSKTSTDDISVWGSVTDLTQTPPPPPTGGPPAVL